MTRYILYLSAAILTFGVGGSVVLNFYCSPRYSKGVNAETINLIQAPEMPLTEVDWEDVSLPESFYAEMVAFGRRGEIVLLGSDIRVSNDDGRTWRVIKGGKGYRNCSRDGGKTYSADCDGKKTAKLEFLDVSDIGHPEMAVITDDGRLYFSTVYEHTGGVWSVPIQNARQPWYELDFTYAADDDQNVYGIRLDMAALGDRVIAYAIQPPEKRLILTAVEKGRFWHTFYEGNTREFDFIDENIGFILGDDMRKTIDGGKSWTKLADLPLSITEFEGESGADDSNFIVAMDFANEQKGYVVGSKGFLILTNDGGKTWQKRGLENTNNLWGIKSLDEKYAWAVGDKGLILETSDGGENWKKINIGLKEDDYADLYDSNIHIDKYRRAVWIIKDGKIYRKTLPF